MTLQSRKSRTRISITLALFLSCFVVLIGRAFQLQVLSDPRLSHLRERQGTQKNVLSAQRGTIHDRRGQVLAVSLRVPSIFVDPSQVDSKKQVARKLAKVLRMSSVEIERKLKAAKGRFLWIKRQVDPKIEAEISALGLKGVHSVREAKRFYPETSMAGQVIGLVGIDGTGLEGIERWYDRVLRSEKLESFVERDAKGRSLYTDPDEILNPVPGADLYLTIDSVLQSIVERELRRSAEESRSKRALALFMDPNDGAILAMASYPFVNMNRLESAHQMQLRNQAVQEVFEPGSTFKAVTIAAALDGGFIQPNQNVFTKKGSLEVSGKVIRTLLQHDWLTPQGILKYSNNIGSSRIALEMGAKELVKRIESFGFGQRTGIDFPGESDGLFRTNRKWRDVDVANLSFGQGISVTAIQLVSAFATIANGGLRVKPHLVDRVVLPGGEEAPWKAKSHDRRVISSSTAKTVSRWLESVTEEGGTGELAAIDGYRMAGKSGTSQKIDAETGRYTNDRVISSFAGFAPVGNPKVVGVILFDEPKEADYGGKLAAPAFGRAMKDVLSYLAVPRERGHDTLSVRTEPIPSLRPPNISPVASAAGTLPDLRGLTVREVISQAARLGIRVSMTGTGWAVSQDPQPGTEAHGVRRLRIKFKPDAQMLGDDT